MRRVLLVTGAIFCAALAIGGAQARTTASLQLTSTHPVGVGGKGFRAREHVRVTLVVKSGRYTQRVIATRSGVFIVMFHDALVDRCSAYQVYAVGNRGSRAEAKRPPLPACLPA